MITNDWLLTQSSSGLPADSLNLLFDLLKYNTEPDLGGVVGGVLGCSVSFKLTNSCVFFLFGRLNCLSLELRRGVTEAGPITRNNNYW